MKSANTDENVNNCIFCRIAAGKAPAAIIYQDEQVTAFHDIHPISPVHILVIPNRHITSMNDVREADQNLLGHLLTVAQKLAVENHIDQTGFRLVINTGQEAGQSVFHLHLHLIGGKRMPTSLIKME